MLRWRKSWIDENLDGSIRKDLEPAERSVWSDLCDLCGKSRRWSYIEMSQGIPYTVDDLAHRFHTPVQIVQSTIDKCLAEGRLQQDGSGTLVVANWDRYQSKPEGRGKFKKADIPLSPEDKEAGQQAAAARLAYLQPDAASRGIGHRQVEEAVKAKNKTLGQENG